MSRRTDYFAIGTAFLVLAGIATEVSASLYGAAASAFPSRSYSFPTAGWTWAAYWLGLAALLCYFAGVTKTPLPPWKRAKFPNLEIEIYRMGFKQPSDDPSVGRWVWYSMRITNRDIDQVASVTLRYRAKLKPHNFDVKIGETIFDRPRVESPEGIPTELLALPLNASSQRSYGGSFVAHIEPFWTNLLEYPLKHSLLIEDHTSDMAVYIPATTGLYKLKDMTPLVRDTKSEDWTIYAYEASDADVS